MSSPFFSYFLCPLFPSVSASPSFLFLACMPSIIILAWVAGFHTSIHSPFCFYSFSSSHSLAPLLLRFFPMTAFVHFRVYIKSTAGSSCFGLLLLSYSHWRRGPRLFGLLSSLRSFLLPLIISWDHIRPKNFLWVQLSYCFVDHFHRTTAVAVLVIRYSGYEIAAKYMFPFWTFWPYTLEQFREKKMIEW